MVSSRLFDHLEIRYEEKKQLDEKDKTHESALYVIELYDNEYVIALGNMRTEHSNIGCIYYPVYLISSKMRIKAKIGVFEVEQEKVISIVDDDGDIDLNKLGEPLLFSFATSEYLEKYGTKESVISSEKSEENEPSKEQDDTNKNEIKDQIQKEEDEDEEEEEEDDAFNIPSATPTAKVDSDNNEDDSNMTSDEKMTYEKLFIIDDPLPTLSSWPTETEDNAKKMRQTYKANKSLQDNWVVRFMNNKEYKIHPNDGSGDCFFITIRDAFSQIGYKTTVSKLRQYLSQEVTPALYDNYKNIYDGIAFELKTTEEELHRLQGANSELKKQSVRTKDMDQQKEIINEAVKVKQDYLREKLTEGGSKELLAEFGFMKHIQSLDEFRTFVNTSEFWGDSWAISTMELLLSVKFIILEETDDVDSVIRCTQQNDEMGKYEDYSPKYYILLGRTNNNHYELISYKDKKIFKFPEVPHDMKIKVVRACIERNENSYYAKMNDFRQFRIDTGLPESTQKEETYDSDQSALFDPSLVLSFHAKSDVKKKAGVVDADTVAIKRRNEFSVLNGIDQWRRKLHDSWAETPFNMHNTDKKRWNSVEHFTLAIPYKESHPALYEEFSDDSKSAISKDIQKARDALVKKGTKIGKYHQIAKEKDPLDPPVLEVHRKEALREKFKKDTEFGRLIKATNMAKLIIFQRNKAPIVDISLMEIRNEL